MTTLSNRNYNLSIEHAEILTREKKTADYFEAFVMLAKAPTLQAALLIRALPEGTPVPPKFMTDYLNVYGEHVPDPTQCAKFIINDLMGHAKRLKINLLDITVQFGVSMLMNRRAGKLTNNDIKNLVDLEYKCDQIS